MKGEGADAPGEAAPQAQDVPTGEAGEILKACQGLAVRFNKGLFQRVFNSLDDELFALTGKIRDDGERKVFFAGLQAIRLGKARMLTLFLARFAHHFDAALRRGPQRREPSPRPEDARSDGLSLVNDSQLEEALAVDNLIAKIHDRCSDELYGLRHRLNHLLPGADIDKSRMPLGPGNFCHAFRDAIGDLAIDIKVRLYAFKLFDRILTAEICPFYAEVNGLLVGKGILPQLKVRISNRPAHRAPQATPRGQGGLPPGTGRPDAAEAAATPIQEQMFQAMQHLLNAHFAHSMEGEGGAEHGGGQLYLPVTPRLVDALSALQQDDSLLEHSDELVRGGLKQHVIGRFATLQQEGKPRTINQIDDETIDVISMIFDYILDDHSLPDFIKALIGRLQIPVLKVAIVDREFFGKKTHPARQLLNELAYAGIGWSEESEAAKDRLYEQMESVVMRILHDFESDIGIFEELLAEFRAFLNEEKKRFTAAQERISEAAQEAEHAEKVKKHVAGEMANRLAGRAVPEEIRDFLMTPWRQVITGAALADGLDSGMVKQGWQVVEDLIWSIAPKNTAEERRRFAVLLPLLLDAIRDGLQRIAFGDGETAAFIQVLQGYHFASMKGMPVTDVSGRGSEQVAADEAGMGRPGEGAGSAPDDFDELVRGIADDLGGLPDVDLDEISGIDDLLDRKTGRGQGAFEKMMAEMGFERDRDEGPRIEDSYTDMVRGLELGTWVELSQGDSGGRVRGKLAWKGDEYTSFSFVNRQFKVVAERPLYTLAEEFRRGTAAVIEDVALFDRAVDGVISHIVRFAKSPGR